MIEKLRKQLFDLKYLFTILFLLPLVALFIIATFFLPSLFNYLAFGSLILLAYLIPLSRQLARSKSHVILKLQGLEERKNLLTVERRQELLAIKSFREKIINFSELKMFTEKIGMCLSLEDTSKTLSEEVNHLLGNKDTTVILYLFHSRTGELGISSSQKGQMKVNIKSKKGDIFDEWIIKTMQSLLVEDIRSDYRFDMEKIVSSDRVIRSLISVPIRVGNKALGILRVDSPCARAFNTQDLRFLTTVGDIGAIAIENAQLYETVEQLAIRDGLTNLFLRRYLMDRMSEELSRSLRRKQPLSFIMIDLDNFKQYNDKFGHTAGDIVLRTVALLLSEFFKEPGCLVCRYGGEEFCVLLPDCKKEKAYELAEEIRKKIANQIIILRRLKTRITVSMGVASFPLDAQIKEELIQRADQALYQAKDMNRNKVVAA